MKKGIYWGLVVVFSFFLSKVGAETKLNQPFMPLGFVSVAAFSPLTNGTRVVYLADPDSVGITQLFSVDYNLGPSSITNLSGTLAAGGTVSSFQISPDGSRVVYLADKDVFTTNELYSVAITGGVSTKLNPPLPMDGDVLSFQISPNGSQVVYRADQDANNADELYSVAITGGGSIQLNDPLVGGRDVFSFQISPNSSQVVYRADQDVDNAAELYSVAITGGGSIKLNNGPLPTNGDVTVDFQISPDSSQVVYIADQDVDTTNELYSVAITGGGSIKLNNPLAGGGDVLSFQISPDSSQVVYIADQDVDTTNELYSVAITGGGSIQLNDPLAGGGDVFNFQINPNGTQVVYSAVQDFVGVIELYSVAITGEGSIKLNDPLAGGGDVLGFQIGPDSNQVFYIADQDVNTTNELYSVGITGGGSTKLNGILVSGGNITDFRIHLGGGTLIYIADQDVDETFELYAKALIAPVITSPLNAATTIGVSNFSYTITANNGPIIGYGASGLPNWASLNGNVITGVPDAEGVFPITLSATNDVGFDMKVLNLTVASTNIIVTPNILPSNSSGFNGDLDRDGTLDLVAQKKTLVSLIAFKTNGVDSTKTVSLSPKDRVVGINVINTNNALIVQNKTTVRAVIVDSNFAAAGTVNLGTVVSPKTKVVASGDINGDGLADIVTQQGKTIGALLSPAYNATTLVNTKKVSPKVVGVFTRLGTTSNAVSSLVLAQGKKLFYYDIPTNGPIAGEGNEPQTGPVFDKKYNVVGAVTGTNIATARLIITQGKKVGIVSYGSTTLGTPIFQTTKKLGKIVGPR